MTLEADKLLSPEAPACADCAHLVGVRRNTEDSMKWTCSARREAGRRDLISGVVHYPTCYSRRENDDLCGSKGKWFQAYIQPEHRPSAGGKASADSLLDELENLK